MFNHYKHLAAAALLSSSLIACSGETAKVEPAAPITEAAETSVDTRAAEDAAARLKQEVIERANAEAQAAKEAMEKAEAESKAAKEAMERAEAEALAAKTAADKKAAKEAMERAEAQARQAEETRRAAAQAQAVKEADASAALAEAEARAEQQRQAEAQALAETQALAEADAARAAIETAQAAPTDAPTIAPIKLNVNAPYNNFLSKYIRNSNGINLVAYDKVTPQDRAALKTYIETLSAMDIEALPRDAEMATWFNLYNAKTIELILENYPTKSIRKISNPWKRDRLVVNGQKMSLDDIEHNTVRRKYKEPRVHYAFNCASIGCPNVKPTAWEAASLEADLTQAARDFIASERGVEIQGNKIIASSIFKWYKKDFGGNEAGILAHLRQYASGPKKAALEAADNINKYDYDWDLNIQP